MTNNERMAMASDDPMRARYGDAFDAFSDEALQKRQKEVYGDDYEKFFGKPDIKGNFTVGSNLEIASRKSDGAQKAALDCYNEIKAEYEPLLRDLLFKLDIRCQVHERTLVSLADKPEEVACYIAKELLDARYKHLA